MHMPRLGLGAFRLKGGKVTDDPVIAAVAARHQATAAQVTLAWLRLTPWIGTSAW